MENCVSKGNIEIIIKKVYQALFLQKKGLLMAFMAVRIN